MLLYIIYIKLPQIFIFHSFSSTGNRIQLISYLHFTPHHPFVHSANRSLMARFAIFLFILLLLSPSHIYPSHGLFSSQGRPTKVAREERRLRRQQRNKKLFDENSLLNGEALTSTSTVELLRTEIETAQTVIDDNAFSCRPATCLMFDGSRNFTDWQFRQMKAFAQLLINVLPYEVAEYAATQYVSKAQSSEVISPLTNDTDAFLAAVDATVSAKRNRVWMVGAMDWCVDKQLRLSSADTKNIVAFAHEATVQKSQPWMKKDSKQFLKPKFPNHRLLAGVIGSNPNPPDLAFEEDLQGYDFLLEKVVLGINADVKRYRSWCHLALKIKCFAAQICGIDANDPSLDGDCGEDADIDSVVCSERDF